MNGRTDTDLSTPPQLTIRDWIETVSHVAQAIAVVVAVIAFTFSLIGSNSQEKYEKEAAAYKTWEEYFSYQIENPDLASSRSAYLEDGKLNPKYIWFVERMVIASEQVMRASPDDVQWQDSIRFELKSHYRYILSSFFLDSDGPRMSSFCTYGKNLRNLILNTFESEGIAESIAEDSGEKGSAAYESSLKVVEVGLERVAQADNECRKTLTARKSSDA